MLIMLIIQVYFKCAVFQSEIKLVTHCYIRLLYLRIIHLILQAASGPSIICDSKILLITYKALNGQAPAYISNLLSYYRPARLLRSSKQNLLRNPCYNLKNYGGRSFAVAAPRL